MKAWKLVALACLMPVSSFADSAADAMAHSQAFARAVDARDAQAVLALYADDARLVWPGVGQEATGKAAIEKLVTKFLNDLPKDAKAVLKSQTAIPLGNGHIATVGRWEETYTDPDGKSQTVLIRTTEIIKKQDAKTLYVVDHASVGLPPAPDSAGSSKPASQ